MSKKEEVSKRQREENLIRFQYQQLFVMRKNKMKNNMWKEDVFLFQLQEDKIMFQLVEKYGTKRWALISQHLHHNFGYKLKTGKQCRERWHNHLNPGIVKKPWSKEEQEIMFDQHRKYGNRWTLIAEGLPGRTDNSIKNHFYSTIRRSLRRMNKLVGSKNSTVKMKNIKPSTLSTIFSLAQGKQSQKIQQTFQLPKPPQINFKQLADLIMGFANWKPSLKTSLDPETIQKFHTMLGCMETINQNYEEKKNSQLKSKKEKLLAKKFDEISEEQDPSQSNNSEFSSSDVYVQISKKGKKKVIKEIQIDFQHKKQLKTESHELALPFSKQLRKISQQQLDHEKFNTQKENPQNNDFNINLDDEDKDFQYCLRYSPGFFSCTPPGSILQLIKWRSSEIRNDECNDLVEGVRERIGENVSGRERGQEEGVLYHSPGSAFRYCS